MAVVLAILYFSRRRPNVEGRKLWTTRVVSDKRPLPQCAHGSRQSQVLAQIDVAGIRGRIRTHDMTFQRLSYTHTHTHTSVFPAIGFALELFHQYPITFQQFGSLHTRIMIRVKNTWCVHRARTRAPGADLCDGKNGVSTKMPRDKWNRPITRI